jgi:hypothetical protein
MICFTYVGIVGLNDDRPDRNPQAAWPAQCGHLGEAHAAKLRRAETGIAEAERNVRFRDDRLGMQNGLTLEREARSVTA